MRGSLFLIKDIHSTRGEVKQASRKQEDCPDFTGGGNSGPKHGAPNRTGCPL